MLRSSSMKACCVAATFGLTLAGMTQTIYAQCEATETDQTSASDGVFGIRFGASTDISGNRIVVGAPDADGQSGAVYVYDFDGSSWNEFPKLLATDTQTGDQCGYSVAVNGDVAVVGAPYHAHAHFWQGAAYVFRFDGKNWTQEQELLASDAGAGHLFGWSVAIDGDAIVVGARTANAGGGAAYVFRHNGSTWDEEDILTVPGPQELDFFGNSVDIDGQVILVGAPGEDSDQLTLDSGSAYVFHWQGGVEPWGDGVQINGSDTMESDMFGWAVAISGDAAIVGANTEGVPLDTGAAYFFRFDGSNWNEEQKFIAPQGTPDASEFAYSVDVDGNVAIISAIRDDAATAGTGSAYVYFFNGSTWTEQAKLAAATGVFNDLHGWSIALSGDVAVVGAAGVDASGGAAYIYDGLADGMPDQCQSDPCPWDLGGDGAVGINDFLELLAAWGTDPGGPPDFDGDHDVGINDFLELLANWGDCP